MRAGLEEIADFTHPKRVLNPTPVVRFDSVVQDFPVTLLIVLLHALARGQAQWPNLLIDKSLHRSALVAWRLLRFADLGAHTLAAQIFSVDLGDEALHLVGSVELGERVALADFAELLHELVHCCAVGVAPDATKEDLENPFCRLVLDLDGSELFSNNE